MKIVVVALDGKKGGLFETVCSYFENLMKTKNTYTVRAKCKVR